MSIAQPELVREFNRLTGYSLGDGSPIERMIDEATGFDRAAMAAFCKFVVEFIWLPLVAPAPSEGENTNG